MIYLKLFLHFFKIGAVSFGGGYGMLPLMRETVLDNGWLTESQFLSFIAVSESTPGPLAVNMATFIGASQGGIAGSLLATLGVIMPSFFIILVIAALVQFVEMFLKKFMPSLYQALGVYLPLITTNCAVLGIALTNVQKKYGILTGIVNGFATAVGFTVSIVILAGIREKMEYNEIPESFKGMPIVLVTAGLMAIAFCGFSGLL